MDRKKLKLVLIPALTTMNDALRALEDSREQILFVTDRGNKLLGTVTDGDIRRHILAGNSLRDRIDRAMRKEFRSVRVDDPNRDSISLKLMKEHLLTKIPVLDRKGVIVDVVCWAEIAKELIEGRPTVAIIPARGGSKGIRNKNLKLIGGKPLLSYVIEICQETPEIDRVIVSTDSDEIKAVAVAHNGVIVVDRPAQFATDGSPSEEAILHAVETLDDQGLDFGTVIFVQATSPLSEPEDFSKLIRKVTEEGYDSAVFCVEDYGYFFGIDDVLTPRLPRQVLTPKKRETGNAWVFRKEGFLRHHCRLFGTVGTCTIEYPKNLEIDTEYDLLIVGKLLEVAQRKKYNLYYHSRRPEGVPQAFEEGYWHIITDPDGNVRDRQEEALQRIEDVRNITELINGLPGGRMLDIGCGMGDLLSTIRNHWEKHGVEVSTTAAQHAAQHGRIHVGSLHEAGYPQEYFDLVVLYHVIEHLPRPEDEILLIRNLLKQAGTLIVGTPDFDGAMAERYQGRYRLLHDQTHVSLFSRISLRHFLEDHGFEIQRETFPFFDTRFFTRKNLLRLLDPNGVSPPFWGSFMTFYCKKR